MPATNMQCVICVYIYIIQLLYSYQQISILCNIALISTMHITAWIIGDLH